MTIQQFIVMSFIVSVSWIAACFIYPEVSNEEDQEEVEEGLLK